MPDIFVSYAREDLPKVKLLVDALLQNGWSIWWDQYIPVGSSYGDIIDRELENSQCVIVVWSRHSVRSNWVKDEALRGLRANRLLPVLIDDAMPPLGFGQIHSANLAHWNGNYGDKTITTITEEIKRITENSNQASLTTQTELQRHTDHSENIHSITRHSIIDDLLRSAASATTYLACFLSTMAILGFAIMMIGKDNIPTAPGVAVILGLPVLSYYILAKFFLMRYRNKPFVATTYLQSAMSAAASSSIMLSFFYFQGTLSENAATFTIFVFIATTTIIGTTRYIRKKERRNSISR